MQVLHRVWHAIAGHKNMNVEIAGTEWSASCDCGYRFHVRHFTMSKIGAPQR